MHHRKKRHVMRSNILIIAINHVAMVGIVLGLLVVVVNQRADPKLIHKATVSSAVARL